MKKITILLLAFILVACKQTSNDVKTSGVEATSQEEVASIQFKGDTVEAFYEDLFVKILELDPQYVTYMGDLSSYGVPASKDMLWINNDDLSNSYMVLYQSAIEKLDEFGRDDIDAKNVRWYLEILLEEEKYRDNKYFLSNIIGEHVYFYRTVNERHLIQSKEDAEDWISRIEQIRQVVDVWIARYNKAIADGYLMDPNIIEAVNSQIRSYTSYKVEKLELYNRFVKEVDALTISDDDKQVLIDRAYNILETVYMPAMKELKTVVSESKKLSPEPKGVWAMPNGEAYYEFALKRHTTTDMTPEEVHQLGLSEVARITKEMHDAFDDLGYENSLSLNDKLKALYNEAETFKGDDAIAEYKRVAKWMYDELPNYFHDEDLPPTEADIRPSEGGNYYVSPSIDGKRPGVYYIDLGYTHYDFEINTLAFHETVPGHHLEREHQMILESTPMIRKLTHYTAYTEGWALYAEHLADENGFNPTPQHRIGYLKSELHRAARLVVDTGIHYKRWTRQEAVDYLVNEGLLSKGYAGIEAARYTTWPGQACSYKIGQLKILDLRNKMKEVQGDDFDIKDFHHLVLGNGLMPLSLLEEYVLENIE